MNSPGREQMSATPASMLQIVASGLQDRERLNSSSPSIAFYKSVMRRRTRWASQWRRVEFDNLADFARTATCTLPILGELVTRATLVVELPDILTPQPRGVVGPSWAWTNGIGHALCAEVQMLIGDIIVDQFDSRLLEVLDEQTQPVEHFDSTNTLIARNPSNYSDQETVDLSNNIPTVQKNPKTVAIVCPFWWNRGPGPQALPLQALWKDKVQFRVRFRDVQDCVYTSTRIDPRNPPLSGNQGDGPLPNIAGCGFFVVDPSGVPIYSGASTADLAKQGLTNPFLGSVSSTARMPTAYHFTDAYWIVEYVSLEDREASAYRMADLEIPIEQHVAIPVTTTNGARNVRIRLDQGGLVRDLTWVAQRVEATEYNAYFLFSRDLGPAPGPPTLMGPNPLTPQQNAADVPWWPNAVIPDWDYGDGYVRPAFADRRSDPVVVAKLFVKNLDRFDHEGPSLFRSLIPALNCARGPIIDRYIYRYDFGFWPTGGLAEALDLPVDDIRGSANWDKMPKRELALTMNQGCGSAEWAVDSTQRPLTTSGADAFISVDASFNSTTAGFLVELSGFGIEIPDFSFKTGFGATVLGIINFNQIRQLPGYIGLWLRTNQSGSSSLVLRTTAGYTWIAVAGAGGVGRTSQPGGNAGSAVEIGGQGITQIRTHSSNVNGGGGGGGVLSNAAVGQPDGIQMPTTTAFVESHQRTGGTTNIAGGGGDGYYGGGSGVLAGGGGGSYVSNLIQQVNSFTKTAYGPVSATLTPLSLITTPESNFNIYAWVTRYNRLRVTSGRGALIFNETA